jgi:hypothetical protein
MAANVQFNPVIVTNFPGTFSVQSEGMQQGLAMDDPASRNWLSRGILASTETLPMWGGVAITESVMNPATAQSQLGGYITRAVNNAAVTGMSVFNQADAWIQTPQSRVPVAGNNMFVPFYRFGSNARIPVQASAALTAALESGSILQQVSWDFTGQQLIPYTPSYAQTNPSVYNSYTSGTGILQLTFGSAPGPVANDYVTLGGFTGTNAPFNGDWLVVSTQTGGTILNIQVTVGLGAITPASPGYLVAGGGAFPCKVIDVNVGNSKVVSYSSSTGFANWTNTGSTVLIQI